MDQIEHKALSQIHPIVYFFAIWVKRIQRYFSWFFGGQKYSKQRSEIKLPYVVKNHKSVLIRKLGVSDRRLQYNKVTNLKIAIRRINGILIKPRETFSFCKTTGLPTRKKGYLEGMELCYGKSIAGIGGGLCQISNFLHWLVLHSPLTVTERHRHSFDPFPDENRVLPFGCGATIYYNYVDFQFRNDTNYTFQINLWITDTHLEGELRVSEIMDCEYVVFEKNHRFIKDKEEYFRTNEIWRKKITKGIEEEVIQEELITTNYAKVMYKPQYVEKIEK